MAAELRSFRRTLPPVQRGSVFAGVMLAGAGAVAACAWYRTLTAEPATSPQLMTWHRADGRPPADPYPFGGCDGDLGLEIAAWRGGVIVSCDDEALEVGWAWLDPAAKRAELRWPLPSGPAISRTRGLIPGPGTARERHVQRVNKIAGSYHLVLDLLLAEAAYAGVLDDRVDVALPAGTVTFVSRDTLLRMKRLAGRPIDLADLEKLEDGDAP
jgi:hypothetical protein